MSYGLSITGTIQDNFFTTVEGQYMHKSDIAKNITFDEGKPEFAYKKVRYLPLNVQLWHRLS
jgi:hypothetical protein